MNFRQNSCMAIPLRFEYAGAVYHVMARGDGGNAIFIAKDVHLLFLPSLEQMLPCED